MNTPRILVTAGSARQGSYNRRLAALAVQAVRALGAEATEIDLRALQLPVYDAEIEAAGLPGGALELRRAMAGHDGLLIAAPEYNAFVTPLLVNSLAWLSRVPEGEDLPSGLATTQGKPVGLLSASPGALGGLRGLLHLRQLLSGAFAMLVLPQTQSVGQAHQAFDDAGQLVDARQRAGLERVVAETVRTAAALSKPA